MIYHALHRAHFRSRLFRRDAPYQEFLEMVEESRSLVGVRMLAYGQPTATPGGDGENPQSDPEEQTLGLGKMGGQGGGEIWFGGTKKRYLTPCSLLIVLAALLAEPSFAQQKGVSSCVVEYENHNQIDYGLLVVQEVKGTITDPQQSAVPKVCIGIFTEKDHKLLATTESDADGKFSVQSVRPGRYRLVVKADPLCAANVPLQVVKSQKKKQVLHVHMKPRGLDSCSYADLGTP